MRKNQVGFSALSGMLAFTLGKSVFAITISTVFLLIARAGLSDTLDWNQFNDPKCPAVFTSSFPKEIAQLPQAQKAEAMARLKAGLKSPFVEVRRRAALSLGALGDKSGVPTMMEDMTTPDTHDRKNVVVALLILNDRRAIPTLRQALTDKSPYVRERSLAALGRMKAVEAFGDIISLVRDTEPQNTCMLSAPAYTACGVLADLGDKRAVPSLIKALDDKDPYLSQFVVEALSKLTKQPFGTDIAKWKQWWQEQPPKR